MNPQLSHALTLALLHFVWQGALIASLCWIVLKLAVSSTAQLRYTIACVGLLAMPVAVVGTVQYELRSSQAAPLSSMMDGARPSVTAQLTSASVVSAPSLITPAHTRPSFDQARQAVRRSLQVWVLPLWLSGVALFCVYRLLSWITAVRLRRRGVCAVSAAWQQSVVSLTQRLRFSRAVVLLESSLTDTPLTMGALRPVILVPVGLLAGLPVQQIELILLHELAHIRRHDYLVNLLQSLVENVLFYHPAVWWVSTQVRTEREFCCDDMVVAITDDRPAYARALADLERQRDLAYPTALAATGGNLMTRIRRILGQPVATRNASAPLLGLLLLGATSAMVAWQPPAISTSAPVVSIGASTGGPTVEELVAQAQAPSKSPSLQPVLVAQAVVPNQTVPNAQGNPASPPAAPTELERQIRALQEARAGLEAAVLRRRLETPYLNWLSEDVYWIATDAERAAFQRMQTNDERERFIEQFWLRRDPTPGTVENEFKAEYYRRLAWANDRLGGWTTDRASIYINFGTPDAKEEHPNGGPGVRSIEQGGGPTTFFPYERWHYNYLEGTGSDVTFEFVDQSNTGEYRLAWNPADKDALPPVPRPGLAPSSPVAGLPRLDGPEAGFTLFEQMGRSADLLRDLIRRNSALRDSPTVGTAFERMQRFVNGRRLFSEQAASTAYSRWINQEVVYIISPEEHGAFQRLATDDERQKFIEQFWRRRDPTPDTPRNEFKDEYYQRIAYANDNFGTPTAAGWSTDRGAIYILFGTPDQEVPFGGRVNSRGGSPGEFSRMIAWNYRLLGGLGEGVSIKFEVQVVGPHPNRWQFTSWTVDKPAPNASASRIFSLLEQRQ